MTKTFCDNCEEEMEIGQGVYVSLLYEGDPPSAALQICRTCAAPIAGIVSAMRSNILQRSGPIHVSDR